MNWEELEKKHQQQWKEFEKLKYSAWEKVLSDKEAMYASFGGKDAVVPSSILEQVERTKQAWREAWDENGYKTKYLRTVQQTERQTFKEQVKNNILQQMKEARENKTKSRNYERDE